MHAKPASCLSYSADPTTLVFTATKTAHSVYVFIAHFKHPAAPKSQHHEHHGACLGTQLLQDPSKTPGMLRWPKVRNEGPIVLMMLAQQKHAQNIPKPSVPLWKASKTQPKIIVVFTKTRLQGLQGRGSAVVASPLSGLAVMVQCGCTPN